MRAASNVLLRDVNVSLIIEEMYRGANVIYADFTDYDELAHHCGPERVESFEALDGVDAAIGDAGQGRRGRAAAVQVHRPVRPRPEPRRDVQAALRQEPRRGRPRPDGRARDASSRRRPQAEGSTFVNSFLSEITRSKGVGPTVARAALASQTTDGVVDLDHEEIPPPADESTIAVVGSGNLGLVWFTGPRPPPDGRGARGAAIRSWSRRSPRIRASAMLMVRSSEHGAVVFGPNGRPLPRRGPRRGRGPDDALRRAHDHEPQARGRDGRTRRTCCCSASTTRSWARSRRSRS